MKALSFMYCLDENVDSNLVVSHGRQRSRRVLAERTFPPFITACADVEWHVLVVHALWSAAQSGACQR